MEDGGGRLGKEGEGAQNTDILHDLSRNLG